MTEKNRFLLVNSKHLIKQPWLIIADYMWWNQHEFEVKTWAKDCLDSFVTEGMIVKFKTDEDRNLFLMRWSNG